MKATLSFDLNDPDEKESHIHALNGVKYNTLIWSVLHTFIRNKVKYASEENHKEYTKALEEVRDFIWQEAEDLKIKEYL